MNISDLTISPIERARIPTVSWNIFAESTICANLLTKISQIHAALEEILEKIFEDKYNSSRENVLPIIWCLLDDYLEELLLSDD